MTGKLDAAGTGPRVSVVIPNFNGAHHLPDCLGSLEAQTFRDFDTIVVDNGSTDGSLELVRGRYPTVRLFALGTNRGFSAAVNEGIRGSATELIILLNNDTRADEQWIERLVAAMDETPEAGFAASMLLQFDPPHVIDAAGDGYSLLRASGFPIGRNRHRRAYNSRAWVFGACAAAAAYRRSMLDDIGLFDEDFVFSFEDIDVDLRAQVAGYRCLYVPDAVVFHKRGGSIDEWSPAFRGRGLRNRIWAAGKSLPGPLFAVWLSALAPRMLRLFVQIAVTGRHPYEPRHSRPAQKKDMLHHHARGLVEGIGGISEKRRAARPLRRLGSLKLLTRLSLRHRTLQPERALRQKR